MVNEGEVIDSVGTDASTIYFQATPFYGSDAAPLYGGDFVPGTGTASFYYSFDNKTYIKIGNKLHMQFNLSVFTGNKFCLFNYATKEPGGFVDFDWFRMTPLAVK